MEGSPLQSDGPEPLWRLAAEAILQEIATGKLASGARLPPERDLFTRTARPNSGMMRSCTRTCGGEPWGCHSHPAF